MIRYLSIVVLAAGLAGSPAHAQDVEVIPGTSVRIIKPAQDPTAQTQFALDGKVPLQVAILPAEAMKPEDKDLAASSAAAIRDRAALQAMGLSEGQWKQSQLDCAAFPEHLLLRFTRDEGAGNLSMFTASIPRGRMGHVRVIPILRRGYSPYSPAAGNKITIAAFNQIRAEEQATGKQPWEAIGMCYAAMTGAVDGAPDAQGGAILQPEGAPMLQIREHGLETVVINLGARLQSRWDMTFDSKGLLVTASHTRPAMVEERRIPLAGDDRSQWRPIPKTVDAPGAPIPARPEGQGKPVPTGPEDQGKPAPTAPPDGGAKPQ